MRIPYKTKLLIAFSIFSVVLIAGCVDTSVQTIPDTIDYSSQMKVVNLVIGSTSATVSLNGESLGTVAYGSETPTSSDFLTIPSGNKVLAANFGTSSESYNFSASSEYKFRAFMIGEEGSSELAISYQRYIWQTPNSEEGKSLFPSDTGQVAFFFASPDASVDEVTISGTETVTLEGPYTKGSSVGYTELPAGTYAFDVSYNDSLHLTFNYDLASKGRYTVAVYDSAASLKSAVFVDD